jgi:3-oxoacyl-[acyl-carrier protein] reductase
MAILQRLAGKTAIVTGAGAGLGAAIAVRFGQEGANVVLNYHGDRHRDAIDATVAVIEKSGSRAIAAPGDVTDRAVIADLFDRADLLGGGADILVNNAAAPMVLKPMADVTDDEFTALMEVNYKAVFFACGLAVSRIRDNGRVLNLSSNSTAMHFPGYGLYDSTKGAVEQITRLLTLEVGGRGVTVNVVAPGPTDTPAFRTRPKDLVEHMTSLSPLNRIGRIEEVVNVMVFLASDEASWITGQNIRVNGGAP